MEPTPEELEAMLDEAEKELEEIKQELASLGDDQTEEGRHNG